MGEGHVACLPLLRLQSSHLPRRSFCELRDGSRPECAMMTCDGAIQYEIPLSALLVCRLQTVDQGDLRENGTVPVR